MEFQYSLKKQKSSLDILRNLRRVHAFRRKGVIASYVLATRIDNRKWWNSLVLETKTLFRYYQASRETTPLSAQSTGSWFPVLWRITKKQEGSFIMPVLARNEAKVKIVGADARNKCWVQWLSNAKDRRSRDKKKKVVRPYD